MLRRSHLRTRPYSCPCYPRIIPPSHLPHPHRCRPPALLLNSCDHWNLNRSLFSVDHLYRALTIHEDAGPFNIASGAILGIGAGLLWTAQGSLMLAYPTENNKGKFIAIFWSIFNLGGVVGAAVSLGQNYDSSVSVLSTLRRLVDASSDRSF